MMKYARYIIIGPALIFLAYGVFIIYQNRIQMNKQNSSLPPVKASREQWETKIDDRPPVTIQVTPIEFGIGKGAQTWKFNVAVDTHSVELDQDFMQIITLSDDQGNVYKPTAWEGALPGGHHREGIVVFSPVYSSPQSVELKIKDVGGIPERSFRWDVK